MVIILVSIPQSLDIVRTYCSLVGVLTFLAIPPPE